MDPIKENWNSLFELTKSQKRGLIVLLIILIMVIFLPMIYLNFFPDNSELEKMKVEFLTYEKELEEQTNDFKRIEEQKMKFPFNPNIISSDSLQMLGLQKWLADRIVKYRMAGGKYMTPDDLKKVYGMNNEIFKELKPYIRLKDHRKKSDTNAQGENKVETIITIDMNRADSIQWTELKGIGPVYAGRIIRYRKILGGFIRKEQLLEVYGINDSLYSTFVNSLFVNTTDAIHKINLNTINLEELRKHPYFRNYNVANSIIQYRSQHGTFHSVDALKNIHLIDSALLSRIKPYVYVAENDR